ncbi:uncharacterized protein LOC128550313 isoform X4 [Mercenaria mercenaria]|uniref:uncharacterized protein LOC128550313 isoform X4 n=1 Tax=Mercenaria mercenaria TaxID=6596 RepID=UPI00234F2806|nr:uncharacterized protein LOC128550313 isoform X4 [Mercenaria mercenaria]
MATGGTHPAALYEQNIKLQEEIEELKRTAGTDTRNVINRTPSCNTICTTFVKKTLLKALVIVLVATCVLTVYLVTEKRQESALQSLVTAVSSPKAAMSGVSGGSLPFGAQNVGGAVS